MWDNKSVMLDPKAGILNLRVLAPLSCSQSSPQRDSPQRDSPQRDKSRDTFTEVLQLYNYPLIGLSDDGPVRH